MKTQTISPSLRIAIALLAHLALLGSISGVDSAVGVRILAGIAAQTIVGVIILSLLAPALRSPTTAQIAAGFVIGFVVIGISGLRQPIVLGLVAIAVVSRGIYVYLRAYRYPQPCVSDYQDSYLDDITRLTMCMAITNGVFFVFQPTMIGSLLLIAVSIPMVMPRRFLPIAIDVASAASILVALLLGALRTSSDEFSWFRFRGDWLQEQVLARTLAQTGSNNNPFIAGETYPYHFFSQLYWGTFERLTGVPPFFFSGPLLLGCSVLTSTLIFANHENLSSWLRSGWARPILLAVLGGSWPFWNSFALDEFSRSQALAICLIALVILLSKLDGVVIHCFVLPVLTVVTFMTKVSAGLFVVVYLLSSAFVSLWRSGTLQSTLLQRAVTQTPRLFGVSAGCSLVLLAYLSVFVNAETSGTFSGVNFGLLLPQVAPHDRSVVRWIQILIAASPLMLVSYSLTHHWVHKKPSSNSMISLSFAVIVCSLQALTYQTDNGVESSFYVAGMCASPAAICLLGVFSDASSFRRVGPVLAICFVPMVIGFVLLERRLSPHSLTFESVVLVTIMTIAIPLILARAFAYPWVQGSIASVLLLSLASSLGQMIAPRTGGANGNRENIIFSSTYRTTDGLENYFRFRSMGKVILAVEDGDFSGNISTGFKISAYLNSMVGSRIALQFFVEPTFAKTYHGQSNEIQQLMKFQRSLIERPTMEVVSRARNLGITHALISSPQARVAWRLLTERSHTSNSNNDWPKIAFEDQFFLLIELT